MLFKLHQMRVFTVSILRYSKMTENVQNYFNKMNLFFDTFHTYCANVALLALKFITLSHF